MLLIGKDHKSINAFEALLQAGLAWNVFTKPVTVDGIVSDEFIGIVREDTRKILGVRKDGYTPIQNQALVEVLYELARRADLKIHSAGMFKGGAKLFMQLETEALNLNGDKIQGFLTAINSHDGSTAVAFGNSTVTISCMNTFFMAYKDMENKFRHTATMQARIDELLKSVDQFRKDEQNHFEIIRRMASAAVTPAALNVVFSNLFNTTFQQAAEDNAEPDPKKRVNSTRTLNNIDRFNAALVGETRQKGETLWGLFSGVTKYTTDLGNLNPTKEESKMMGAIAKDERAIFATLTKGLAPVNAN